MTEKRFILTEQFNGLQAVTFVKDECVDVDTYYTVDGAVDLLNEVVDENDQLKQRNNRQMKQLDHLYNLIEEKDWRTLTDILDDFKRCEEQLHKEWGTYGD